MRKLYELSELDTISAIRKEIKNDLEQYNLFRQTPYIAGDKFNFYRNYLLEQIEINIEILQKIVEGKND
jgi:hypothetical protein